MGRILDEQHKYGKKHERALLEEVAKRLDVAIELKADYRNFVGLYYQSVNGG